jgi:hypothetical protein
MNTTLGKLLFVGLGLLFAFTIHVEAAIFYVNCSNPAPASPFATWDTAATNIQDAIDASTNGDLVLVTNGIYQNGGHALTFFNTPYFTNRIALTKPITVSSVNGADVTFIKGAWNVSTTNGPYAVRCAYLTNGASLIGFTLTNGATGSSYYGGLYDNVLDLSGGGLLCASTNVSVMNCVLIGNSAYKYGGGAYSGTMSNCTLIGNFGYGSAGGAMTNVLINCLIASNFTAWNAGGAYGSILNGCTVNNNQAGSGYSGGGLAYCSANNCNIYSNSVSSLGNGGGAYYSVLTNCVIYGNIIGGMGGGTAYCSVQNSFLFNNIAGHFGGGSSNDELTSCIVSNNSVSLTGGGGGGVYNSSVTNCSVIWNNAHIGGGVHSGTAVNCIINNNSAQQYGGGVVYSTTENCLLANNFALQGGGGESSASCYNCLIVSNISATVGGGCYEGAIYNCTIANNTATNVGGGVYQMTSVYNSVLYNNIALVGNGAANNFAGQGNGTVLYCSTTPLPTSGTGNFTNAPLFVNLTNDFHLQANSPCINAGKNAYVSVTNDLDRNPRILGGTVDMGAYEYQTPSSLLSYAWAQQYGLPTDGSVDYADSDGTGMNNWQKWIAGLNPTNHESVLAMQAPVATNNAAGVSVSWQSVNTRVYYLQRATDLTAQPAFSAIQSNIVGQAATTSYLDTTATNGGPYFYRVGVQ